MLSNEMSVSRAQIHKMLIRIANSEGPYQKQSDLGLHCLCKQIVFEIIEILSKTSTISLELNMISLCKEYNIMMFC